MATLRLDEPDDSPRVPRALAWHPDGRALTLVHRGRALRVEVDPLWLTGDDPLVGHEGGVCVSDDGAYVWPRMTRRPVALFGASDATVASFDDGFVWFGAEAVCRSVAASGAHVGRPHFAPWGLGLETRAIVRCSGLAPWWSVMGGGGSTTRLVDPPYTPYAFLSWSPCGTRVLMRRGSDALCLFEVDGENAWTQLGETRAPGVLHAALSHDGTRVATLARQRVTVFETREMECD